MKRQNEDGISRKGFPILKYFYSNNLSINYWKLVRDNKQKFIFSLFIN